MHLSNLKIIIKCYMMGFSSSNDLSHQKSDHNVPILDWAVETKDQTAAHRTNLKHRIRIGGVRIERGSSEGDYNG